MDTQLQDKGTERLFIAIKLPSELSEPLGLQCRSLAQSLSFAKWTHPEDYHITLQFLGDTAAEDIPKVIAALKEVASGASPFRLALDEWGTFGVPAAPRVLWAGVSGELEKLNNLQQAVTAATSPLGFSTESRPYNPHLTLARKYRGDIPYHAETLRSLQDLESKRTPVLPEIDWTVNSFLVYATMMHAIPMYEMIENMTFF